MGVGTEVGPIVAGVADVGAGAVGSEEQATAARGRRERMRTASVTRRGTWVVYTVEKPPCGKDRANTRADLSSAADKGA